jgi:chorismate mutase
VAIPELEDLRKAIDDIDRRILALIRDRIRLVLQVGDLKRQRDLAVRDSVREESVLATLSSLAEPPLDAATVRRIYERIIDESRTIEERHVARDK